MIRRLLIANRGEIALRIVRAAKDLGIETVVVCSDSDRDTAAVGMADQSVCIGPPPASLSYLSRETIVHAALAEGCDAVHPGYGFLAEDYDFASACISAGLRFVGPKPETMALMGDKVRARQEMAAAGVPILPGSNGAVADVRSARELCADLGYPVLLKAQRGGGGRGMRVVEGPEALERAFTGASKEAEEAFADPGLYLERFLRGVRHIEVQILGDDHGRLVHFGERDCSVQRRHQKLVEECPSPVIAAGHRESLGRIALSAANAASYVGAGTIEFLVDTHSKDFFFMEMNTRIQVEHPVTEEVFGIDLVSEQLRIAGGEPLEWDNDEPRGHAIEYRINAEDSTAGFSPHPGVITEWIVPDGPGIRVDTHCSEGTEVPPYYDSLLAKLVVRGRDREQVVARSRRALGEFHVGGLPTTLPFHRWLVNQEEFVQGSVTTDFIDRVWPPDNAAAKD